MKTYYSKTLNRNVTVPEDEIRVVDGTTTIGYFNSMEDLIKRFFHAPHVGFNRRMTPQNYSYFNVDTEEWISWLTISGLVNK